MEELYDLDAHQMRKAMEEKQAFLDEIYGVARASGEDSVWLGDLSGFAVCSYRDDYGEIKTALQHRCGWEVELAYGDHYLANLIEVSQTHKDCRPYTGY